MRPNRLLAAALVLVAVPMIAASACSKAGAVGDACTTPGSTTECDTGAICDKTSAGPIQCLKVCTVQTDCAANQDCNGVTGSSIKACQAKSSTGG